MSYLDPLVTFSDRIVKFHGPFNLEKLVRGMKRFVESRGYKYHEIYKMKKSGAGWAYEATTESTIEATGFVKKVLLADFRITDIKDVEVMVHGKKETLQHGTGTIMVRGNLEFGYTWPSSFKPFLKWFLTYFYSNVYWGKWVDMHFYEVEALAQHARVLLGFEVK